MTLLVKAESRRKHLARVWMDGDRERIRKYNERKKKKWGEKIKAQTKLRNAVKSGKVIKLSCEWNSCGIIKTQGHHEDYNKPLEVKWLCDRHHKETHKRLIEIPAPKKNLEKRNKK